MSGQIIAAIVAFGALFVVWVVVPSVVKRRHETASDKEPAN